MSKIFAIHIDEFVNLFNDVVETHKITNDPIPVLNKYSLANIKSALVTPFQNVYNTELYPSVYDKAAILAYLIIHDHPLDNGNKRMGYLTMTLFLYKNGIQLNMSNDEVYHFSKKIAASNSNDKDSIIQYIKNTIITHTMTKTELESKIAKARKNTAMPEALKAKYIAKIEKQIADLEEPAPPKGESLNDKFAPKSKHGLKAGDRFENPTGTVFIIDKIKGNTVSSSIEGGGKGNYKNTVADFLAFMKEEKAVKSTKSQAEMEKAFGKEFMASKDKGAKKTFKESGASLLEYERAVIDSVAEIGEMTNSDAQGVSDTTRNVGIIKYGFKEDWSANLTAKNILGESNDYDDAVKKKDDEPGGKGDEKITVEKVGGSDMWEIYVGKKSEGRLDGNAQTKERALLMATKQLSKKPSSVDYDCDELISKEKARKASSKKSDKKPEIKKSETAIKSATEGIKNKYKEGDLTKDQILKLIQELRKDIKQLENLLKSAK